MLKWRPAKRNAIADRPNGTRSTTKFCSGSRSRSRVRASTHKACCFASNRLRRKLISTTGAYAVLKARRFEQRGRRTSLNRRRLQWLSVLKARLRPPPPVAARRQNRHDAVVDGGAVDVDL